MAASRKKNETTPALRPETKRGIASIILFLFATVSSLALINKAGVAGLLIKESLTKTFGVALFVIPLLLFLISISLAFSLKRSFTILRSSGALLFFISTLGFVAIFSDNKGGAIGNLLAKPLVHLLDIGGSATLLATGILVSLFIIFDVSLIDITVRLERAFIAFKNKKREPAIIDTTSTPEEALTTQKKLDESPEDIEENISESDTSETSEEVEREPSSGNAINTLEIPRSQVVTLEPWENPPLSLLERDSGKAGSGDVKAKMNIIKRTLQNFGIDVEMDDVTIGPSVTRYALKPAEGVKLSRIVGLQDNLAYMLAAHPIRIEAPIPGKSLVGIEIPNTSKATVGLGSLLSQDEYQKSPHPLLAAIGKDITGTARFANLAKMPHLLIAGATGSGKSVTIHAIINSLLYKNAPEALRFIMIDPKRVELTLYNGIPHLISPVVTDAKKTIGALRWAAKEMDRRYDILEQHSVRDIHSYQTNVYNPAIDEYKKTSKEKEEVAGTELPPAMPYIVIIIDELADIMATFPRELEASIVRLAQMSRAVGIHLILSTQRPSVNVITGLIKANVPARIALQVASQIDSRTILDMSGAENLLGAGDMLYLSADMSKPIRLQSAFISEPEVKGTVSYLKKAGADRLITPIDFAAELQGKDVLSDGGKATLVDSDTEDELYEDALEIIMRENKASTSLLQRKLSIGYGRAAKIIDQLESRGIVGPATSGSKARELLTHSGETTGAETPRDRIALDNLQPPEETQPT